GLGERLDQPLGRRRRLRFVRPRRDREYDHQRHRHARRLAHCLHRRLLGGPTWLLTPLRPGPKPAPAVVLPGNERKAATGTLYADIGIYVKAQTCRRTKNGGDYLNGPFPLIPGASAASSRVAAIPARRDRQ